MYSTFSWSPRYHLPTNDDFKMLFRCKSSAKTFRFFGIQHRLYVLKRHVCEEQHKVKTGWTITEAGKDRSHSFQSVESRPPGSLLISRFIKTVLRSTCTTTSKSEHLPNTNPTLPTNENRATTQATLSSGSLLELHEMRWEITESVMKESVAELAKGIQPWIQHRQEMENAISACKLKRRADY